jgi:drug/metabolite transporter (DMT)-like permease
MRATASPLAIWGGLLTVYLVWGSTYLGIAVAVESIPPFFMGAIRFAIAGGVLVAIVLLRERRRVRRPSLIELRDSTIVGGLLLGGGMGLVAWGEQTIPSGVAALLIGLMPAWLALFTRIAFGDRLPLAAGIGIVVGLAGVAILAWPVQGVGALDPAGLTAIIVSPMLWSTGTLYAARRARLPASPLLATGLQMLAGAGVLLVIALVVGDLARFDPQEVSTRSMVALAYLTLIGSLIGFTAYAWLLTVAPLPRIATYAYVNPVVAVILGAIVLSEPLTPRTLLAGTVIVGAVALIITARSRAASRHSTGGSARATASPRDADSTRPTQASETATQAPEPAADTWEPTTRSAPRV